MIVCHKLLMFLIFCLFAIVLSKPKDAPLVKLVQGTYIGKTLQKSVMFLGIPYALPPTGSLRFKPPVAITEQSNKTFDATDYGLACIPRNTQSQAKYGEDCLNLDIYAPTGASNLPVMVFIFGGGFDAGNSHQRNVYNGGRIINRFPKVVIVCINYRLNVFGFLSGSEVATEGSLNAGLLDQQMAFLWVRHNINAFGGDPTRVTAWGHSAGAISVSCHLMANKGPKLFDRAILLSGPPNLIFLPASYRQDDFNFVAKNSGCFDHPLGALDCMRKLNETELQKAGLDAPRFGPTLDNVNVVQTLNSFQQESFSKIPVLISTTDNEGIVPGKFIDVSNLQNTSDYLARIRTFTFNILREDQILELARLYPVSDYKNNFNAAFADFFSGMCKANPTDFIFKCPSSLLAENYERLDIPVYSTKFTRIIALFRYARGKLHTEKSFHGSDLPFYWQFRKYLTPPEYKLADQMTSYLIAFASGQPENLWKRYRNGWSLDLEKNRMVRDSDSDSEKCDRILEFTSELIFGVT
jgi:para-nitrobenzyl esterase